MATNLYKHRLLLLRQALDNSTANFRPGQWEPIEELLQELNEGRVRKINRPIAYVVSSINQQLNFLSYDSVTGNIFILIKDDRHLLVLKN